MKQIRWGIIGPGAIAGAVARDFDHVEDGVLHAVASRSTSRAQDFARDHNVEVAYGSYRELLDDDEVDAVYLATPHRQHHAIALAAIAAGKHLLVEKSFTCTLAGAQEIVAAARTAQVFCMEGMWTRFQPAMVKVRELLDRGHIGDLRSVRADLGFRAPMDPRSRLWDPDQGGGAMLDVGVYPVSFIQYMFLEPPQSIEVAGSLGSTGVDQDSVVLWRDENGATGVGQSSLISPLSGTAALVGTQGRIEIPLRFHHPTTFRLYDREGEQVEVFDLPPAGIGYSHEFDEANRCIGHGLLESPTMPLDDTLAVMQIMEEALARLGVTYTEDPEGI